jgi:N-acyl-D-aspartate/D-glutamate deacylase
MAQPLQATVVIRGGTVVDGTGAEPYVADIAIDGETIKAIGKDLKVAGSPREVAAHGLMVTPGWIDVHTHYDAQVTWDPMLSPSANSGVTTAIMGNCGVGFAPCQKELREFLVSLMEAVEDSPGTALNLGIKWEWETFP